MGADQDGDGRPPAHKRPGRQLEAEAEVSGKSGLSAATHSNRITEILHRRFSTDDIHDCMKICLCSAIIYLYICTI